uniref:Uncharacterized protein n=1 Tax=Anguilla anguilla TaxID=7936 RepID=A0A0E9WWV7_ANGAN
MPIKLPRHVEGRTVATTTVAMVNQGLNMGTSATKCDHRNKDISPLTSKTK